MKTTDPYSPTLPAKASAAPVNGAGASSGRTTRLIVGYREAPGVAEDSSIDFEFADDRFNRTNDKRQSDEHRDEHAPGCERHFGAQLV